MDPDFRGEVADFYHKYRRGYPPAVIDMVMDAFGLTGDDIVVDLGCGTGQLALPIAGRVRAVAGVDPEPDMLARARQAADEQGIANACWMIGADTGIPAIRALLGSQRAGAVTIGQALHWMHHDDLFQALTPLVRHGGGVAVITNGTPLWLQDGAWSQVLRRFLEHWLGATTTATCGTDAASQRRYCDSLTAAGYDVQEASVEYQRPRSGTAHRRHLLGTFSRPDSPARPASPVCRAGPPCATTTRAIHRARPRGDAFRRISGAQALGMADDRVR